MKQNTIKDLLLAKLENVKSIQSSLNDNDPNITKDQTTELNELSQAITESNVISLIEFRKQKEIKQIQSALARIEEGNFGCCSDCGGDIEDKRLAANPLAVMCIECQLVAEKLSKQKKAS